MTIALARLCAFEALHAYVIAHHEHPESYCQFPRASA